MADAVARMKWPAVLERREMRGESGESGREGMERERKK